MQRREFMQWSAAASGAAAIGSAATESAAQSVTPANQADDLTAYDDPGFRGPRTLLFLDYFPLTRTDNVSIKQSTASYVPEGDFVDPLVGRMTYHDGGSQPYWDDDAQLWRRIEGYPDIYRYESEDGIRWRISPEPDAQPPGGQKHPHHLTTAKHGGLPCGTFVDPQKVDGYRFKIPVLEGNGPAYRSAVADETSFWHRHALEAKSKGGAKFFRPRKHSFLCSPDGVNWEYRPDYNWGQPNLITEEHFTIFFNHHTGLYTIAMRARWGDRRIFFTTSADFKTWTPPRMALHPDVMDQGRIEFHGSSISRYDSYYIALVWYGNYSSADNPHWTGKGTDQTHLAHSYDGQHFIRGLRKPLIPLTQPGQPEFNGLWTRGLIRRDEDILIYSDTWEREFAEPVQNESRSDAITRQRSSKPFRRHVIHRLRRDGFTYLEAEGHIGTFQTHWIVLHDGEVCLNADASHGVISYEVAKLRSGDPIEGFSFDECVPLIGRDEVRFQLRFKEHPNLQAATNRQIYIRFRIERAKVYSLTMNFGTDPTHRDRIELDMPIHDPSWIY
ncbi:hypothetical protein [Stratiformator vulcanicus]|uniref:Glycosyl hydrolase family 32 N-terminal domain-containing protein n=1 Tax=Stratiformator vulcanicus TaxID=2527980 RepID=A0A517R5K8_9PLAN|nr:hypothetical protein [Stratiformator vulcanicus]QDT39171.1 hypothetical protein Pan189_35740 [Stratiformator vulcanicus]